MKHITHLIAVSLALVAAGCATGNLPRGARAVGGGLRIHWWPPNESQVGTAILVEKRTGAIVLTTTRTVSALYPFEFDVADTHDEHLVRTVFAGSPPTNAQYVLYFVPLHK